MITEAQAGWSALAYKATSGEKNYFLKVYDKHKHTAQSWIRRIDDYIPILLWLEQNTKLRGRIPSVILSVDRNYKYTDADFIYILFEYIDGDNLFGMPLSKDLIKELAEIIAELHSIDCIPILTENLAETFDISFCKSLSDILQSGQHLVDIEHILASYSELILNRIRIYESLAEYLHSNKPKFVLCHTDIHCGNIMQDSRLKLIDWEGIRFAPAEADLFSFSEGFFFENFWGDFLAAYKEFHPDFQVNSEALRFYRLRRLLEDISSFTEGLMYDNLVGEERIPSLDLLEKCCLSLRDV
jgi:aminoglycoside phosphotransferase (APT) family kinase protein